MSRKAIIIDSSLAQYTAEELSFIQKFFLQAGVLGDSNGVLGLAVTQRAAGANLSVDVAVGNALIDFTKNATTWKIVGLSNAIENVVIPTQSSGANRVGALIMRASVTVEPNVLKNNIITLEFVPGTSTSPLSDGAISTAISNDMFIRLANITVPTGASSIVDANIADTRVQCKTNESIKLAPQTLNFSILASDPANPVEGQMWYNSTTHTLNFYNNTTVKQLGSTAGAFNPFVTTQQSSPNMTLLIGAGEARVNESTVHYAGGSSPAFLNPGFAYDIELALLPSNGETITIVVNGTSIVFTWVTSIGSSAGNILIQGTVAACRAALVSFLNNPSVTNANQVALSGGNQTLIGYLTATDDLTLKAFVCTVSSSLTSLSMSETMAGAGNVVTANTTRDRVDVLYIDNTGTPQISRGAYSGSPTAPAYPYDGFVIAEVYCRRGMTSVKTTDDSTNGYILRDTRGIFFLSNAFKVTAGEDISIRDAVIMGDGTLDVIPLSFSGSNTANVVTSNTTSIWGGWTFTVPAGQSIYLKQVKFWTRQIQNGGQPAATTTLSIRATSGGLPTGADLDTATDTDNSFGYSPQQRTYNFSGAVLLTAGQTYAVCFRTSAGSYENYSNITSSNSGSTWSVPTLNATPASNDFSFRNTLTLGKLYRAITTQFTSRLTEFFGFAIASTLSGQECPVKGVGVLDGFSGLTKGKEYWIDSTYGAITATQPATGKRVGVAISTTALLIEKRPVLSDRQTAFQGINYTNGVNYTAPCDGFITCVGPYNATLTVDGVAFPTTTAPATVTGATITIPVKKGKVWTTTLMAQWYFTPLM